MADKTLDDVLQDVTDESTVADSLISLTSSIKAQLDAILAGTTVAPAVQAKYNAVFAQLETNKAKWAAAVLANTPAAPAG
jgi:ribosomal silencing factor RsfS